MNNFAYNNSEFYDSVMHYELVNYNDFILLLTNFLLYWCKDYVEMAG